MANNKKNEVRDEIKEAACGSCLGLPRWVSPFLFVPHTGDSRAPESPLFKSRLKDSQSGVVAKPERDTRVRLGVVEGGWEGFLEEEV